MLGFVQNTGITLILTNRNEKTLLISPDVKTLAVTSKGGTRDSTKEDKSIAFHSAGKPITDSSSAYSLLFQPVPFGETPEIRSSVTLIQFKLVYHLALALCDDACC